MSLIKVPYNRVHVVGDVLFASRGGQIHAFGLSDSKYISSWKHPDVDKAVAKVEEVSPTEGEGIVDAPAQEGSEPPAKRQKVDDETPQDATQGGKGKRKGKKQGGRSDTHAESSRMKAVSDRPIVTLLASTTDGKHIVAVSGHDKAIWVFAHDGQGNLTQLSQRYDI